MGACDARGKSSNLFGHPKLGNNMGYIILAAVATLFMILLGWVALLSKSASMETVLAFIALLLPSYIGAIGVLIVCSFHHVTIVATIICMAIGGLTTPVLMLFF